MTELNSAAGSPLELQVFDTHMLATLNRPEKRNAIDQDLIDALHDMCAVLEKDPKTLILRGAGGDFAAGADIAQLLARGEDQAREGINTRAFMRVAALPMPVIAVVDGFTLGGGAELAYAADIRVGSRGLKIGNPEPGLGIIAAAGATWRLPAIVGDSLAYEMLLSGRVLTGEEALQFGLVTHLLDTPEEAFLKAEKIAAMVAKLDPKAVRATKRAVRAPLVSHPEIDLAEQAVLFESPEKKRRMTEFLERGKKK